MTVDWDHYDIDLSSPKATAPAPAVQKAVAKRLASPVRRLGAQIVDFCIWLIPLLIAFIATYRTTEGAYATAIRIRLWFASSIALGIIQLILLSVRGQTLGKIAAGIRIVDFIDDTNPGFYRTVVLRVLVPLILWFMPLFAVVDILFIFSEEHQCIHDLIAGTKVVET
jgi:uncharacterized RDD family membrane protein YckC